jgi:hypothetical protein
LRETNKQRKRSNTTIYNTVPELKEKTKTRGSKWEVGLAGRFGEKANSARKIAAPTTFYIFFCGPQ